MFSFTLTTTVLKIDYMFYVFAVFAHKKFDRIGWDRMG